MALTRSRIFLLASAAAGLGFGLGERLPAAIFLFCGMAGVSIAAVGWMSKTGRTLGALVVLAGTAAAWANLQAPPDLSSRFGQAGEFSIAIVQDPEPRERSQKFKARLLSANNQAVSFSVMAVLPRYPAYRYGQVLRVKGELSSPDEFDRKDGVSASLILPEVVAAEQGPANPVKAALYRFKGVILEKINALLPEPHSGLLGGLLLGTRRMPPDLLEAFRATGTSHIVAVSGFNVTIVANFFSSAFRRLGSRTAFYLSILGIIGFVVLTGASASVVRAGVMGSLGLLARRANRLYDSPHALVFTAALMLGFNPRLLLYDIGFQLSFAAMAGLLFAVPKIESRFPQAPAFLKEYFFPTLSAQLATTGLLLYHFGSLSLVSLFANLLILPAIPAAMLAGALAAGLGFLLPPAAQLAAFFPWLALGYIIGAALWTARLPQASLEGLPFPWYCAAAYYALLIIWIRWKPKPKLL